MEQIVIRKLNGGELPLFSTDAVTTVTRAEQYKQLLGEDTVTISLEATKPLFFDIGDSILAFGDEYVLNQVPAAVKKGERRFSYELTFEGAQYSLLRAIYFNQDVQGVSTGSDFTLTGDLPTFVGVLMNNIGRVLTGWVKAGPPGGAVPTDAKVKTLSFSNENCLAVLQRICKEFETEFEIVRSVAGDGTVSRTLSIKTLGAVLGQTFEYGRGKGLYNLQRQNVEDKDFITRLYAFGAVKNLKSSYRNFSQRLRLPVNTAGGEKSYLEKASSKQAFGLIEGSKNFDDIYPRRTGTVTALGADVLSFVDTAMDFDLLAESGPAITVGKKTTKQYSYLIDGVTAKIHFNSGKLAGYEFQVSNYSHASRTFSLVAIQDERGQDFPAPAGSAAASAFQISVGDKYVILDVIMPESYIVAAETELEVTALNYLDQNSAPRVQYTLSVDEMYLRDRATNGATTNFFALGDTLQLKDADLNVDGGSRVISFRRDLIRPYAYSLEIADTYQITLVERILAEQAETKTVIRINDLRDPARARYGWRTTQELLSMVFDTDDYFKDGNIRPESIETSMLVVGAKSQQFVLNCVIEANYQGAPNVVKVNAGSLTHYTIEETIRTWQLAGQTTTITDDAARYVYAKCHRTNYNDAALIFSTAQLKPGADQTYYHFLVGVLHAKDAAINVRWVSLTYGATSINGRFIKTGRVQSADGKTYFDLDEGAIGGKITFLAADGTSKPIESLPQTVIDGGVVTSGSIRLAGTGGNVLAGITGEGTSDNSVRFWAGSSYDNRAVAPFRVLQSGEVFARKRIEMMSQANVGQAGMAGANTAADGPTRIWAGSPYANRATAPFRVDAAGAMTATAGYVGNWQISNGGIINVDGQAYVIARNNTTAFRTEARMGSQVFPATSGLKGAMFITATENDDITPNIAIYAEAANGGKFLGDSRGFGVNYALFAPRGLSMLSGGLLNGRAYYGRAVSDVNLIVDPSLYDVLEIYPAGNSAGLKFKTDDMQNKLYPGKTITIINCHDTMSNLFLIDVLRGNPQYKIEGGCTCTIMMGAGGFWYQLCYWDNNWGESDAPAWPVPDSSGGTDPNGRQPAPNPAPTLASPIPDQTIDNTSGKTYVVPAGTFSDTDTLTWSANLYNGTPFPDGLSFDSATRTFTFGSSLAEGTYRLTVTATDTANQSVSDDFVTTISRVPVDPGNPNPAPTVANPIADQTVDNTNAKTYVIPANTFSDTDTLTYSAKQANGSALPTGLSFNASSRTFSFGTGLAEGSYTIAVTATDTANQSVSDSFVVTISRATSGGGGPAPGQPTFAGIVTTTRSPREDQVKLRAVTYQKSDGTWWFRVVNDATPTVPIAFRGFGTKAFHSPAETYAMEFPFGFALTISFVEMSTPYHDDKLAGMDSKVHGVQYFYQS